MPIYEYVCTDCGKKFDLLRSYSKADEPAECKNCHSFNSKRALSLFNAKSEGRSITSSGCDSCNGGSCGSCHHLEITVNHFENKNVLITGGSSGIGFALAKLFLQNDARVWIIARDENKLKNAVKELSQINSFCKYFVADVSNIDAVNKMFNNLQGETDKIDFLINCAGVAYPGEFERMELEKFHWLMDINFFGTVNVIKTCLPLLRSGAHIINVSSMAGLLGVYGYTAYGASKYAVRGFSDALRSELKLKNINVSIVYPPDTDTPQLEFENQFKPAITKEIAGSANPMSVSSVAQEIFNGILKKNYIIIPGFENKLLYFASNFLGKWVYPIMDLTISNVVKKLNQKKKSSDLS